MTRIRAISTAALAITLACPTLALAANKEHQQLMAEIRMLQEQQQQLQQILGTLGDTLKTLSTRLDEQGNVTRKAFADQRLLIEGVGDTARILREKADDTNVRLSTIAQELEAMRQTIASQPQAAAPSAGDSPTGTVTLPAPQSSSGGTPVIAPQKIYDNAFADYSAGQYDLAIEGFEAFIKTSPRSELADDAQLNIGNALYAGGKFQQAVAAYQAVVATYPQSNSVPAAYYKMGLSYQSLKLDDLARKALETVIKNYPDALAEASLARQALERMNKK